MDARAPEADAAQRLGPLVDAPPSPRPGPIVLEGRYGRVERLDAARHGAALWAAMRDQEALWTHIPYGPFDDEAPFQAWVLDREQRDDPYCYAVIDPKRGAVGVAALMEIRPAMRVIEVGHIVYGGPLQRTPLATEAQYLLARYAFETLGYRRYEWKCNALNLPSRRAAARYGFTFEGIFRQHMIVKGRSRDTAWHAMLDSEWPARKRAFETWLHPDNFDAIGRQKTTLSSLNGSRA
jgi:RimJ/RimL family protein N-acetyltransferase